LESPSSGPSSRRVLPPSKRPTSQATHWRSRSSNVTTAGALRHRSRWRATPATRCAWTAAPVPSSRARSMLARCALGQRLPLQPGPRDRDVEHRLADRRRGEIGSRLLEAVQAAAPRTEVAERGDAVEPVPELFALARGEGRTTAHACSRCRPAPLRAVDAGAHPRCAGPRDTRPRRRRVRVRRSGLRDLDAGRRATRWSRAARAASGRRSRTSTSAGTRPGSRSGWRSDSALTRRAAAAGAAVAVGGV
jgi:hypothetical protein